MKRWRETSAIFDRVALLAEAGERAAIATVVQISGSAYRRPGARFLVEKSGHTRGGVSGGCLEADVRERALEIIAGAPAQLLHYDTGGDEETVWGLGLGCEGAVDVFVQAAGPEFANGPLAQARALFAASSAFEIARPFALSTVVQGADAGLVRVLPEPPAATGLNDGVFVEVLEPPPLLLIFGAGDDAQPLAQLAATAGFDVTVIDHRRGYVTADRFPLPARAVQRRASEGLPQLGPRTFAVVQTHSLQHDRDWLRALIPQPLAYLGLLGPRARKEELLAEVGAPAGRVFAPVGLDLGAEGPEQVAVAVVAELLAVLKGRAPGHLRDRRGGIHD